MKIERNYSLNVIFNDRARIDTKKLACPNPALISTQSTFLLLIITIILILIMNEEKKNKLNKHLKL